MSITGGVHFDLVKRVLRDIQRSGQAPEEIIQQISDTVYPMYKAYIEPDLRTAHLKIHNAFNPFSGFMNATYILKSATEVSKERIKSVLEVRRGAGPYLGGISWGVFRGVGTEGGKQRRRGGE